MNKTKIEWTDATWNPTVGCSKVSEGCRECYAIRSAHRLAKNPNQKIQRAYEGITTLSGKPNWTGVVRLIPERLEQPMLIKRPTRWFVNSMSDLFHEDIELAYIRKVFKVMRKANWHTFQILTKRSERVVEVGQRWNWPDNVWMGVSVENQRWTCRVDDLRRVPAKVRFLSCEPLLGPLRLDLRGIGWVIVGGESGARARPMKPEWVRDIRQQCKDAGVAFFFKQWGAHNEAGERVGKGKAGRLLDGRVWGAMPLAGGATAGP